MLDLHSKGVDETRQVAEIKRGLPRLCGRWESAGGRWLPRRVWSLAL